MDDIVSALNHFNLSSLTTFLLVALLAALRWIGYGIVARIESAERDIKRFREKEFQDLADLVQRHTTEIAVVKMKLGMDDDD